VITPEALLDHWQGHRRLTRRVTEAFPEEQLFQFSIGGMRPFSDLVKEFIKMEAPTVQGISTGNWSSDDRTSDVQTKADLLRLWDEETEEINRLWPAIPAHSFQQVHLAFGQWEGPGHYLLSYVIDNEIHHRGQGYVYLRALGIEPPAFFDRS
jgi:uncharacterized damage-inducible protein DinB